MNRIYILYLILFNMIISSCDGQNNHDKKENHKYTNELINESSPYLLQHAHNPVDWYPWGDAAFQKAKDENKMVIISVGYAACHWCHVMEQESFENVEVANYMNEYFVCIKVDREERPDVDQIYMTAAQLLNGSGGWPLNALALADGKPFFAATYFPKKSWMEMMEFYVDLKKNNPNALVEQADKVTKGIIDAENITFSSETSIATMEVMDILFKQWKTSIDFKNGGENHAPKFPMPSNWEYLLQYNYLTNNTEALKAVTVTLDNMANGGIYDQLGGGFARYSTDVDWIAPHFEKMLYDNAELVSLYSHAYQVTKNPLYKKVVVETIEFIDAELSAPKGGFYSSLDADSEGEEGKYYVWQYDEIKSILKDKAPLFINYYGIKENGNWEHKKNILLRNPDESKLAKIYNLSLEDLASKIATAKKQMLAVRAKRIKPRLDDKILTAWNAMMIKGYIDAYRAFGNEAYKQKAISNADFLVNKLQQSDKELFRNYKNNKATIHGMLDDYAFAISSFIAIYQATFDEKWLYKAKELNDYTIEHFFDKESGMFFYTHNTYSGLIARKMEVSDNVIPASNSEMAKNLFYLGLYFDNKDYSQKSKQMLMNVQEHIHTNIRYYSNWASLELLFIKPPYEVAIVGPNFEKQRAEFATHYLPNTIFLGGKNEGTLSLLEYKLKEGSSTIYVCKEKVCQAPTTKVDEALKQIK